MSDELYVDLWYYSLLVIVLLTAAVRTKSINNASNILGFFLIFAILAYIAFRPISPVFGDTTAYARAYNTAIGYKNDIYENKDWGFGLLTNLCLPLNNVQFYFFIIACIYVIPLVYSFKVSVNNRWYILFLLYVCSFSFWGFGVNGLRNGISTSTLVLAFFSKDKLLKYLLFFIAISFHKSALLPISIYFSHFFIKNPKKYIFLWIISIPLTIMVHSEFENYLSLIDINDESNRLSSYATSSEELLTNDELHFSRTGFRWDFVLYSLVPIITGYYFIFLKKYYDRLYISLFIIYVGCNTFWLYTMYLPFNNRFAYLSWFLYPILIAYPLLKKRFIVQNQETWIRLTIILYYSFTFFMYTIK